MQGIKKRAVTLSAALALALTLAACDSADPDDGTDGGDLGVTTTIFDPMVTTTLAP